jgi:hypothetical protein
MKRYFCRLKPVLSAVLCVVLIAQSALAVSVNAASTSSQSYSLPFVRHSNTLFEDQALAAQACGMRSTFIAGCNHAAALLRKFGRTVPELKSAGGDQANHAPVIMGAISGENPEWPKIVREVVFAVAAQMGHLPSPEVQAAETPEIVAQNWWKTAVGHTMSQARNLLGDALPYNIVLQVEEVLANGGMPTSHAVDVVLKLGNRFSIAHPLRTDDSPFLDAFRYHFERLPRYRNNPVDEATLERITTHTASALLAQGIPLDRIRVLTTPAPSGPPFCEKGFPFISYTADGYYGVDVRRLVHYLDTEAGMALASYRGPNGSDLYFSSRAAEVKERLFVAGVVGFLLHEKEEINLLRIQMAREISRRRKMSYENAAGLVDAFFAKGFIADPEDGGMINGILRELSTPENITKRHQMAEARYSLRQFKEEQNSYCRHVNNLAERVMKMLRQDSTATLREMMALPYWRKSFHFDGQDREINAFQAQFMVWAAYERVRHRRENIELSKKWTAATWKQVIASEIEMTEWKIQPQAQSPRGKLRWNRIKDKRPVWAEHRPIAPEFIPEDISRRRIKSLLEATQVANSAGIKTIITRDEATETQLNVFLRLQRVLEMLFFFDEGLATGGTMEPTHQSLAFLVAGLRGDSVPPEVLYKNEDGQSVAAPNFNPVVFADRLEEIFKKAYPMPSVGLTHEIPGKMRKEMAGYARLKTLAQLDDYHFAVAIFSDLRQILSTEVMPTYGNEHWLWLVDALREEAENHLRVPMTNIDASADTVAREFGYSIEDSYAINKEAGAGTAGHAAFNEGVMWFFYRFYRFLPWYLQTGLARTTYSLTYRYQWGLPVMRLMALAPWMKNNSPDQYGLSWTHVAPLTDTTLVQNCYNILNMPEDEDIWKDVTLVRLVMGRCHTLTFGETRWVMRRLLRDKEIPDDLVNSASMERTNGDSDAKKVRSIREIMQEHWDAWREDFPAKWDRLESTIRRRMMTTGITQGTAQILAHSHYQTVLVDKPHKAGVVKGGLFGDINDEFTSSHMAYSPWTTRIIVENALPPSMTSEYINRSTFLYDPPHEDVEPFDRSSIAAWYEHHHGHLVHVLRPDLRPPADSAPSASPDSDSKRPGIVAAGLMGVMGLAMVALYLHGHTGVLLMPDTFQKGMLGSDSLLGFLAGNTVIGCIILLLPHFSLPAARLLRRDKNPFGTAA